MAVPAAYGSHGGGATPYSSTGVHLSGYYFDIIVSSERASFSNYVQKSNPWLNRLDWYILTYEDSGLRVFWQERER